MPSAPASRRALLASLALATGLYLPVAMPQDSAEVEQKTAYDLEFIIFRHARPLIASEQWPEQTLTAPLEGAVDFNDDAGMPLPDNGYSAVAPEVLSEQVAKLRQLSNFKVLAHFAWRQPGEQGHETIPIRVAALPLERPLAEQLPKRWDPLASDSLHAPGSLQLETESSSATGSGNDTATQAPVFNANTLITHQLDGTVTVIRRRFLHVYTDLVLTLESDSLAGAIERPVRVKVGNPIAEIGSSNDSFTTTPPLTMQSFPIRIHRRMRSGELHYLDHPLLGMLVIATRIESDQNDLND